MLHRLLIAAGLSLGVVIGYLDSRPSWDDTALTAGMLVVVTAILGAIAPQRPWLWALAVGLWIPVFGIVARANYGSLIALLFAFAGAYGGMLIRRMIVPAR